MILHAKVPLDEVLEHRRTPAAGRIPGGLRSRCDQGGQLLALHFGQFAWPSWRVLIDQTGHTTPEKPVEVVADGCSPKVNICTTSLTAMPSAMASSAWIRL